MSTYTSTSLYRKSFYSCLEEYTELTINLRDSYEKARCNMIDILAKIRFDFPQLTIHDITHVDSLWQTASAIVGEGYEINPLEGFILGCSFLFHDAALSYEAYGGKEQLRNTVIWKDCYADEEKYNKNKQKCIEAADFKTARLLHARCAESMVTNKFTRCNQMTFYVIEDDELRDYLGESIGKISASHHWNIKDVSQKLDSQVNAPYGFPPAWTINEIKLACILRCADAGHLDSGRAPSHLFKLLKLNGVSYNHWSSQNRLSMLVSCRHNPHAVQINSMQKFKEEDFEAWNVAYDAITVLDKELKASNQLLGSIDSQLVFKANEVLGASSRAELSKYVKVEGWKPCDANVHISNVANLIENLGGQRLYGEEDSILIVVRELIQNARDAIKAREIYDKQFRGCINIKVEEIDGNYCLSITDNGIGMTPEAITTNLLGFGTSYWASDLSKEEYPGLRSSSFRSVGKYGIGFFSVFMIADYVTVETRKYDDGIETAQRIKFPTGLTLTPILSNIVGNIHYSTTVTLVINPNKYTWRNNYIVHRSQNNLTHLEIPFHKVLCAVVAGLDTDVYYEQPGVVSFQRIHQNIYATDFDKHRWLKDISFCEYQNNSNLNQYIDSNYQRLEFIYENHQIVGLVAINTFYEGTMNFLSVHTIGGLVDNIHNRENQNFIGWFDCIEVEASRKSTKCRLASESSLKALALKQKHELLQRNGYDFNFLLKLPYVLCDCKINTSDFAYMRFMSGDKQICLNFPSIIEYMERGYSIIFPLMPMVENIYDYYVPLENIMKIISPKELLFLPDGKGKFINLSFINKEPSESNSFIGILYSLSLQKGISLCHYIKKDMIKTIFGMDSIMYVRMKHE